MRTARIKAAIENEQDGRREKDGRNDDGESDFHAPDMDPGALHFQPALYAVLRPNTGDVRLRGFQPK